jgi:AcrR family transcriptional regulator
VTAAPGPDTAKGAAARPRRVRGRLNTDAIVAAAFAIAARAGLGGLTFQALGAELHVHPTAIYRHFRHKDELLLALVDALHAEALAELPEPTEDWAADLRTMALKSHEVFLRHPAIAQLAARTARREHEFQAVERDIACMRRAGLGDRDAARFYRTFADMVLGYAALDAQLAALDAPTREADLRAWDIQYRRLPKRTYPNIAAVAEHLPRLDDPANFELAVDMMISAIAHAAGA